MPPKSAKDKNKKKVLKGTETPPGDLVKKLLLAYEAQCKARRLQICVPLRLQMKKCIDEEKLLAKVIIEHKLRNPPKIKKVVDKKKRPGGFGGSRKKDAFVLKRLPPDNDKLPLTVEPLFEVVRMQRYLHLKDLYIWGVLMPHPHVVTLCDMLEKGSYPVRTLALQDCLLSAHSMQRLGRAVSRCQTMQTLDLDYNEFGDEGCKNLCDSLRTDKHLLSLSLCYCNITSTCGTSLAKLVSSTILKDLYLNGNDLGTKGVVDLVEPLLDFAIKRSLEKAALAQQKADLEKQAQQDAAGGLLTTPRTGSAQTLQKSDKTGGKKKKKKKKKSRKKKRKATPVVPGPWIWKLHLADNGIHYKKDPINDQGLIDTVACMNLLARFVSLSDELRELDLDDNWISDSGSRDLLEGLKARKEAKLPKVSLKVNYKMEPALFAAIQKAGSGGTLKKKRRRKKKKK